MKHVFKFIPLFFNVLCSEESTFYFSHFMMHIWKYIFKRYQAPS